MVRNLTENVIFHEKNYFPQPSQNSTTLTIIHERTETKSSEMRIVKDEREIHTSLGENFLKV